MTNFPSLIVNFNFNINNNHYWLCSLINKHCTQTAVPLAALIANFCSSLRQLFLWTWQMQMESHRVGRAAETHSHHSSKNENMNMQKSNDGWLVSALFSIFWCSDIAGFEIETFSSDGMEVGWGLIFVARLAFTYFNTFCSHQSLLSGWGFGAILYSSRIPAINNQYRLDVFHI